MLKKVKVSVVTTNGKRFDWVHVDVLREFFNANPGQPFNYLCMQDLEEADEIPDDVEYDLFIPDGNLIKEENGAETAYENWLCGQEAGPYTATSSEETFYYLSGKLKMAGEANYENYKMQLCSKPMNYLSMDALDGCHVWVLSSEQPRRSERLKKLNKH